MDALARLAVSSLLFLALLLSGSCSTPKQKRILDDVASATVTHSQLRLRMLSFLGRFTALVERAADEISSRSNDPTVRRRAASWKIGAVAQIQWHATADDPMAALLGSWWLTANMRALLDEGAGRDLFGEQQATAVAALRQLETEVSGISAMATPDHAAEYRELVYQNVQDYPFEDLYFTAWLEEAPLAKLMKEAGVGIFAGVASLQDQAAHLTYLLRAFASLMPRQAAWNAELVAEEILARQRSEGAIHELSEIAEDLDAVGDFVRDAASLIASERTSAVRDAIEAIDQQRVQVVEAVDREVSEVLKAISTEREAVLAEVRQLAASERAALVAALGELASTQRETAVAEARELIAAERASVLDGLAAIVNDRMETLPGLSRGAVDWFWWRAIQVLLVLGAAGGLAGFLALRYVVRAQRASAPREA